MPEIGSLEEEVERETMLARTLIRNGQADAGLQSTDELTARLGPRLNALSPEVRYLVPFTKARAYMQLHRAAEAKGELEIALALAHSHHEARARVLNLLGVIFYGEDDPAAALRHHLDCLHATQCGVMKDLNFRLSVYQNLASVYQNLANDYWALNDMPRAIGMYKEALDVVDDLDEPEKEANLFWGLALACKQDQDWGYAKLYAVRAIQSFKVLGNQASTAAMCANMAEMLIEEGEYKEAATYLGQAECLLGDTAEAGLRSFICKHYAELALRQGDIERAARYATESLRYAETLLEGEQAGACTLWINPLRTYAEALHMSAQVQEGQGNEAEADRLFERALSCLEGSTAQETRSAIHLSYAGVLEARGDSARATVQYRLVGGCTPRRALSKA